MYIVDQRKTISRYRISQSSYTWEEAMRNVCTPTSHTNVHISEGQRPQSINFLVCVSFSLKNGGRGWVGRNKTVRIF